MSTKSKKEKNRKRGADRQDPKVYSREKMIAKWRYRSTKRIVTNEGLYFGVNANNTLEVSLIEMIRFPTGAKEPADAGWRVCVWGNDDFGMELDVESRGTAEMYFDSIVDLTTRETLLSWGFTNA